MALYCRRETKAYIIPIVSFVSWRCKSGDRKNLLVKFFFLLLVSFTVDFPSSRHAQNLCFGAPPARIGLERQSLPRRRLIDS